MRFPDTEICYECGEPFFDLEKMGDKWLCVLCRWYFENEGCPYEDVADTTDNGVRYLIHKIGTPQFRNVGGVLAPSGEWWHDTPSGVGSWGDKPGATLFSFLDTDTPTLPDGGEWVAVFLNVSVNGEVG
jgi:hypothetical protein